MPPGLFFGNRETDREQLLSVVRSVRNRWRLRVFLRGAAILMLSAAALLLIAGFVIDIFRFDATAVTITRVLSYIVFGVILLKVLILPLLRRVSDQRVALYLEEHEPSLEGRVISAVEFGSDAYPTVSPAMVERVIHSAVEQCHKVDDGKRVERQGLRRSSGLIAGSTVFGIGLFLMGPAFLHNTTPVLLTPWEESGIHNPYRVLVVPGDTMLAKGADLKVLATLQNFDAGDVELVVRSGDAEWTRWSMLREDTPATHSLMLFDLHRSTEYFVEASGVRSPVYRVDVVELPYVEDINVTYYFPRYTGLDPVEQIGSGDIAAVIGTRVALEVIPTIDVPGGAIVIDGRDTIPLTFGEDGRLGGELTVRDPGSYKILLDSRQGHRVVASSDYLIDPFTDQPPSITMTKPGRDIQVTSLEEVLTEVRAQDDYGVRSLELIYSVNGGTERIDTLYAGSPGRQDFVGTHTLFLEEYGLQPGDLISYYARALDGYRGRGKRHEAISDIYFLEIRPFDRNFRQADQGNQPGQPGMRGSELSAQQRMIIAATFKLLRDADAYGEQGYRENLSTVALSQGRLREEVIRLAERLVSRGVSGLDSSMAAIAELLPLAAAEMTEAEEALGEHRADSALPPEQKALQYLQRAEAVFRDVQVAQGQQGGGAGGEAEISEELADLFELELDRLSNQYEQVQRSNQQSVDNAIDETLEKLRELARRQQQENERMRARAQQSNQQTHAGSSGQTQRQLADEAEEVARQLERLAREESLPDLAETARQLREAAEEMRRAAASGEQSAEAVGNAALDQLREARRQLERDKSGRLQRDTRAALDRTRRLLRQQERMTERVEKLDPTDPGYVDALRGIQQAKERMASEVGNLEAELEQLARDSRRDQPEASRKIQEAAGLIRDNQIREKILYSRGVVQQRSKEYARNFEEHIEGTLLELEEQLEEAQTAIGETREQRLEQALEETREVVTALESLEDRLRAAGEPQDGQAQGGPRGGQQAAGGDSTSANPNVSPQNGSGRLRPQDLRQFNRELDQRRAQLQELRDQLRQEGIDSEDLDRIIDRLRGLGSGSGLAGPETIAVLERDIVQGLKEFEYTLRRSLNPSEDERLLQVSDDEVPGGYEEMVENYYKALAGEQ
ncbi:MAG: DUF4175 family protein [Gemmatimonadales bacterium]